MLLQRDSFINPSTGLLCSLCHHYLWTDVLMLGIKDHTEGAGTEYIAVDEQSLKRKRTFKILKLCHQPRAQGSEDLWGSCILTNTNQCAACVSRCEVRLLQHLMGRPKGNVLLAMMLKIWLLATRDINITLQSFYSKQHYDFVYNAEENLKQIILNPGWTPKPLCWFNLERQKIHRIINKEVNYIDEWDSAHVMPFLI